MKRRQARPITLQLPELIALFATPGLKALVDALLKSPEQLAWVFRFQQLKFLETLPEKQRATFESVLAPIINNNFNFGKAAGSGPAFAQMTAQVFEEVGRNTERLHQLEALDVPVKMIWGDTDLSSQHRCREGYAVAFEERRASRPVGGPLASN
jgi:haloalkane dehalogenase